MEPILTRLLEQDAKIQELESTIRQKDRTVEGMKHWLKVAATYKVDHLDPLDVGAAWRQIEGMQAALLKAAEYQGREQNPRRSKRRK